MPGRMHAVEDWVTGQKATATTNIRWLNRLWPMIYAAAGIAG
jgi:hypothetical protein